MGTEDRREVGLVSCVKTKREEPAAPRDLYTSAYFEKMREYAEKEHDEWWILSAKHGLLDPDGTEVAPYEETLTTAGKATQRQWAQTVFGELEEQSLLTENSCLVLHAGTAYYEELLPLLEETAVGEIQIPCEGLQIGHRLAWYNDRI